MIALKCRECSSTYGMEHGKQRENSTITTDLPCNNCMVRLFPTYKRALELACKQFNETSCPVDSFVNKCPDEVEKCTEDDQDFDAKSLECWKRHYLTQAAQELKDETKI